jgi:hypothetical protein
MVKKTICSMALVAALIPFVQPAPAQDYKGALKPTLRESVRENGPLEDMPFKNTTTKPAPGMCGNPARRCLFYGGDFVYDPFYPPIANALSNEDSVVISGTPYGGATWVPFTVPKGETWYVTGLFTNNESTYGVLDQGVEPLSVAYWSINQSVFAGNAGTVIASFTSPATSTPTGRGLFGLNEYTVQVTGLSITLTPGEYWMAVVPICTNTADPYCLGRFFLTDVEYINVRPKNAFGPPEPVDASFFDSPFFGFTFGPANSLVGVCFGAGCDAFSAGVLGSKAE